MEKFYVLYDGNCGMCRRTTERLRALDLTHCLTFLNARRREEIAGAMHESPLLGKLTDEALMRDMHAVTGDKVWKGFEAYRAITGRLPLLWPVWPFLWLWPVSWCGRRVYRHVADSRSCEMTS